MKKRFVSLAVMIAAVLCSTARAEDVQSPAERLVRYKFVLTNQKGTAIPDAEFRVRAPVKQTAHQRCVSVEASCPYELVADPDGNQTLVFRFKEFPPFDRKFITVKAVLELTPEPSAVPVDPSAYLGAAPMMELDSPEFKKLAPELGRGTPERIAQTVMRWVQQYVEDSGYEKRDHGALYALQQKKGDCTEQAFLFAALCRAHGIPARVFGGYLCTQNAVFGPMGYHLWAEFFDGKQWRLVDPQNGVFATHGTDYVALCAVSETGLLTGTDRFCVVGNGLTAEMK